MKFKIGDKYTFQFYDHCVGESKVLCEVTMYITKEDKSHIYGTWWRVLTEDEETEKANREIVSIIKSTIVKKRKLTKL